MCECNYSNYCSLDPGTKCIEGCSTDSSQHCTAAAGARGTLSHPTTKAVGSPPNIAHQHTVAVGGFWLQIVLVYSGRSILQRCGWGCGGRLHDGANVLHTGGQATGPTILFQHGMDVPTWLRTQQCDQGYSKSSSRF
uniref:Zinc metalloproteinase-disintegrin stejnihagin-A n=1 Tax=Lygus hesperus TaxID=30085 RepID=A0A0A9X460_LYGHE